MFLEMNHQFILSLFATNDTKTSPAKQGTDFRTKSNTLDEHTDNELCDTSTRYREGARGERKAKA